MGRLSELRLVFARKAKVNVIGNHPSQSALNEPKSAQSLSFQSLRRHFQLNLARAAEITSLKAATSMKMVRSFTLATEFDRVLFICDYPLIQLTDENLNATAWILGPSINSGCGLARYEMRERKVDFLALD